MFNQTIFRAVLGVQVSAAALLLGCSREVDPWSEQFGVVGVQSVSNIAVGPDGEVALIGDFSEKIDFGDGPMTIPNPLSGPGDDSGELRSFLALRDAAGGPLWGRQVNGDALFGSGVAIAPNGDVLVSGNFFSKFGVSEDSLDGKGAFLARLDHQGKLLWDKEYGPGQIAVSDPTLALAQDGSVVIGGQSSLESGDFITFQGAVARFDVNGEEIYEVLFDGSQSVVNAVAADSSGAALIAGTSYGDLVFGDKVFTSTDSSAFVAKLDPDGAHRWLAHFGDGGSADVNNIALDPAGDVVVAGSFKSTISFGDESVSAVSSKDGFVAKLSGDGKPLWFTHFGNADSTVAVRAVAVDSDGHVFFTGYYNGKVNLGGGELSDTKNVDQAYLAELDADGVHVASGRISDSAQPGSSLGTALALDPRGDILLGGSFSGALDTGEVTLTSKSARDIFLLRRKR